MVVPSLVCNSRLLFTAPSGYGGLAKPKRCRRIPASELICPVLLFKRAKAPPVNLAILQNAVKKVLLGNRKKREMPTQKEC